VVPQPGCDVGVAGSTQETDGGIPQHGTDGRPLRHMHQAGIFTEIDILAAMPLVLDPPMAALERQSIRAMRVGATVNSASRLSCPWVIGSCASTTPRS